MNAPRIALPIPTTADQEYNRRSWPRYAAAIQAAGGEVVEMPLNLPMGELQQRLAACDGFCLPGSPADVDPSLYGQEADPATAPADPSREAFDRAALEHAEDTAKPVLGICYGAQFLNVWRGGSLVQDLAPLPVNHAAGASVAVAHSVLLPEGSALAAVLAGTELEPMEGQGSLLKLPVNSSHHQAAGAPGDGLRLAARCPADGVIEAIEGDPAVLPMPLLGVQWHPERSTETSAASRALFSWLVGCAVSRRGLVHAAGE